MSNCRKLFRRGYAIASLARMFSIGAVASGCATSGGVVDEHGGMDGGPAGGGGVAGTGAGASGGMVFDAPSGGQTGGAALVYAHTDTMLFRLDPTAPQLDLVHLGQFDCVGGQGQDAAMTDIAVDKAGKLWGVSHSQVHTLELQSNGVHCATSISLDNPAGVKFYGLTFAPVGTLDATAEVLVAGNTAGELWSIDAQGKLTQRGTFGIVPSGDGNGHYYDNKGKPWELSGDIVFVENQGSPLGFATVRDCPNPPSSSGCSSTDTLIEIDVLKLGAASTESVTTAVRGQIMKHAGCNDSVSGSYGSMYGIGAWGDRVYGFSRSGNLVEIDTNDGSACLLSDYADSDFAGAGVTTKALVTPPTPK